MSAELSSLTTCATTGRLHHAAIAIGGAGHYGMIFMPGGYSRAKRDTGRIVTAVAALLASHPGTHDLANAEAWL